MIDLAPSFLPACFTRQIPFRHSITTEKVKQMDGLGKGEQWEKITRPDEKAELYTFEFRGPIKEP
jgi:hypothetical protein